MYKRWISVIAIICLLCVSFPLATTAEEATSEKIALTADMVTASSTHSPYTVDKVVDGDTSQSSYWEGGSMPASLTIDLKDRFVVDRVVLKVPTHWGDRSQTISVSGSANGAIYGTIVEAQSMTFSKSTGNQVTIAFPQAKTVQYLQITVSANTGATLPQIAECEVYGYISPNAGYPVGKLDLSADMVTASGTSYGKTDNVVDGNQNTFWNGKGATATMTLDLQTAYMMDCVVMKLPTSWGDRTQVLSVYGSTDGARYVDLMDGQQTLNFQKTNSNVVSMTLPTMTSVRYLQLAFVSNTGDSNAQIGEIELYGYADPDYVPTPTIESIALTADMITASGQYSNLTATNAVDGDRKTYWQGNSQSSTLTLDLQTVYCVSHFILRLPNTSNWGTRTQTLVVNVSTDGVNYSPVTEEVQLTFQQNVGDCTLMLDQIVNARYVQLAFSSNTGDKNGPQVGEWEVYGYAVPAKKVNVVFAGKKDVVVATQTVSSADELVALLDTVKVPALGGYVCVDWDENEDALRARYEAAAEGDTITVRAIYEVDTSKTYTVTVTNAETDQVNDLTFDSRVTVTATGDQTPSYWLLDGAKVGFGQKSYTFYVSGNNNIEPQYDAVDTLAEVTLQQAVASTNGDSFNLSVVAQTSVKGKDVTEFGVIYAASPANLTTENSVKVVSSKTANQQYMTHLLDVKAGKYRYAVAYLTLADGTTVYSAKAVQFHTNADGSVDIIFKEGWNA